MARIVYRGAYATFPMVGLIAGDLAYATDLNLLFEWSGAAWFPYRDYPDYEGGKSKLFTAADWAAVEATDLNFGGVSIVAVAYGAGFVVNYTPPAGRIFYITQFACSNRADLAADGDNNQICFGQLQVGGALVLLSGGNGGFVYPITKPIVVGPLILVAAGVVNYANHNTHVGVSFGGYLI